MGQITSVNQVTRMTQIVLRDWGRMIWRPFVNIYHLEDRFHRISWQTFVCGLAYTGPAKAIDTWPKKTKILSWILGKGQEWINIVFPLPSRERRSSPGKADAVSGRRMGRYQFLRFVRLKRAWVERKETVDTFPFI